MNFKDIHIGEFIQTRISETNIEMSRICNFLNCTEEQVDKMYKSKDISAEILLRWSKLLTYDFFRIYSQHLILYAPPSTSVYAQNVTEITSKLPQFRKNIYTKGVIYFILELIETKEKTIMQVIAEYNIPKTTLYKWIRKYKN